MNQSELIDAVSAKTDLSKTDATRVVKAVFAEMTEALKTGQEIRIPGFGGFAVTERAAREGRNPKTGEVFPVPAGKAVKFKAGKELRDTINAKAE